VFPKLKIKVFCFFFSKSNPKKIGRHEMPSSRSEPYEKKQKIENVTFPKLKNVISEEVYYITY